MKKIQSKSDKKKISFRLDNNETQRENNALFSPCSILLLQAFTTLCLTLVFIFYTLKRQFIITTNKKNKCLLYYCILNLFFF